MVTVVITSFNRFDLLEKTILSFNMFNTYMIKEMIIIEDSADKEMHEKLKSNYSRTCRLILNEENIGAYASIDLAYSLVTTPWVLHLEDDWVFTKGGFVEPALEVIKGDSTIMQVNFEQNPAMSVFDGVLTAGDVPYRIENSCIDGWWHGFTCHPSLRSMAAYEKIKPWAQWSVEGELPQTELIIGQEYFRLGYKAAQLMNSYCYHAGVGRCTWHENE